MNRKTISMEKCKILLGVIFFSLALTLPGSITPRMPVKIVLFPFEKATISSLINSYIEKYNFSEGERFKKGDVIVELQNDVYHGIYEEALGEYNIKKSKFEFNDSDYKESLELFKKDALSQQELKQSKMECDIAKAELYTARARVKVAKYKLQKCRIKAPYDGTIIKKITSEYEYVNTGEPIVEIISDTDLLAIMHVPSEEINKFKKDQELTFHIDEIGKEVTGKVYELGGEIDSLSRTYEVKALIKNNDRKLLAGMSGYLVIK